jgi:hypothetical protein
MHNEPSKMPQSPRQTPPLVASLARDGLSSVTIQRYAGVSRSSLAPVRPPSVPTQRPLDDPPPRVD